MPVAVVRDDGGKPGAAAENAGSVRRGGVKTRVLLLGGKGRMGQAIAAAAAKTDAEVTAALDLGDDVSKHIGACDVVIDFSSPNATDTLCAVCRDAGKPAVIGTTGHSKEERA